MDEGQAVRLIGRLLGLRNQEVRADRNRYLQVIRRGVGCSSKSEALMEQVWRCDEDSQIGLFDFDSVMQSSSSERVLISRRPECTQLVQGNRIAPTWRDGSNVLELYAQSYGWSPFVSLGLDRGDTIPLDPTIPNAGDGGPGAKIVGNPALAATSNELHVFVLADNHHLYERLGRGADWSSPYEDLGEDDWKTVAATTWNGEPVILLRSLSSTYVRWPASGHPSVRTNLLPITDGFVLLARSHDLLDAIGIARLSIGGPVINTGLELTFSRFADGGGEWRWRAEPNTLGSYTVGADLERVGFVAEGSSTRRLFWRTTYGGSNFICSISRTGDAWQYPDDATCCETRDVAAGLAAVARSSSSSPGTYETSLFYRSATTQRLVWIPNFSAACPAPIDLGGEMLSDPAVALTADGRIHVVAVGRDGGLWHRYWTPPP